MREDKRCRVCGTYSNNLHHPSCPIGQNNDTYTGEEESEEMFVVNEDMLQYISHAIAIAGAQYTCLLYTSPSPRDATLSRMPSSA